MRSEAGGEGSGQTASSSGDVPPLPSPPTPPAPANSTSEPPAPVSPTAAPLVSDAPLFAAFCVFASGILLEGFVTHPLFYWLVCSLAAGLCALPLLRRRLWLARTATLLALLCAGAFTEQVQRIATQHSTLHPEATIAGVLSDQPVELIGWLRRDGQLHKSAYGSTAEQLDFVVEQMDGKPASGGIRLNIYVPHGHYAESGESEEQAEETVAPPIYLTGQRLRLRAKLHPPSNYKNPGAFDYAAWLRQNGIDELGSAKAETVEQLPGIGGSPLLRWRMAARRSVIARIHTLWPQPRAGLFDAMLIGEHTEVSREERTEFQRSGTYHLLVVSGMNVAIFAAFLFWLVRRLHAPPEWAATLTILITVAYSLLTELGPPILRAVLMLAIWQFSRLLYRERNSLNGVSAAALLLVAWNPGLIRDPSFQMTFLAVLVMAGIAQPVLERSSQPWCRALRLLDDTACDQSFEPLWIQRRLDLRLIEFHLKPLLGNWLGGRILRWTLHGLLRVYELAVLSLLMQLSMALPMIWYFHRMPFRAFWANLAVVPLTGVLMPACMIAVTLSYASLWLAKPAAWIASLSLTGITGTVHTFGAAALHETRLATPPVWMAVLAGAALALALLLVRRNRWFSCAGLALLAGAALWLATPREYLQHQSGTLEVTAIDVGQGDSLLIVTPDGKKLLLDAGGMGGTSSENSFDVGEEVTSAYLWQRGIQHLDAVAFSHGHSDHIGGMIAIIANFRPDEIWFAANLPTVNFQHLMKTAIEYQAGAKWRHSGDTFNFGGANVEVLSPLAPELKPRSQDDDSMVLRLGIGQTYALLPGDIHSKVEEELLARYTPSELRSELLKVAHHGSATSTTPEFLTAVSPELAVVSCGEHNSFHHPRPQTLESLQTAHVRVYRTDKDGAVSFLLDGRSVKAVPFR